MGDHYYRPGVGEHRYEDSRYDGQQYNPPRYDRYEERDYSGGREYRDHEYDRYSRDHYYERAPPPPPPPPPRADNGYTFRGAAERRPYQPQEEFSFRAPGPHFPPQDNYSQPLPPQRSRRMRGTDRHRGNGGPRAIDVARERHASTRGRGRGGFRSKAAHRREILSASGRETTPEQLEGMNLHGDTRFHEVASTDDDVSDTTEVIDLTGDGDAGDDGPRKRTKLDIPAQPVAPKWSNPDPYTALPPPESLGGPKKDIVQVIRKAKNDALDSAHAKNLVQENVDFISLNFDDDFNNDEVSDDSDGMNVDPDDASRPSAPAHFSHRPSLHAVIPSAQAPQPNSSRRRQAPTDSPPLPPDDLIMPTEEELVAQYLSKGSDRKRKRDDSRGRRKGGIGDDWKPDRSNSTPWCISDYSDTSSTALRLHKEICDFYDFVRPYEYEESVRQALITRIQKAVRTSPARGAPNVEILCFGSFAAGLYLPTADMDLVAVTRQYMKGGYPAFGQSNKEMRKVSEHLTRYNIADSISMRVISKAKVPIIKFDDLETGIHVDVSFENDSGLKANETFRQWKADYPAMPVLVVLIKQLLAMRNLNEVYLGGIGGFTIICMVVSMMQLMPEIQSGAMKAELHYGELLMHFLDLYGNRFDVRTVGIRMSPPGYFDKIENPMPRQNNERLTIEDPNNAANDIAGGSHEIKTVLDCFRSAHIVLQRRLADVDAEPESALSILGCMWGGNYTSFMNQRQKLSVLHRGHAATPPPASAPQHLVQNNKRGKSVPAASTTSNGIRHRQQQSTRQLDANENSHSYPLPPRPPMPPATHALPPKPITQDTMAYAQDSNSNLTGNALLPTPRHNHSGLDRAPGQNRRGVRPPKNEAEAQRMSDDEVAAVLRTGVSKYFSKPQLKRYRKTVKKLKAEKSAVDIGGQQHGVDQVPSPKISEQTKKSRAERRRKRNENKRASAAADAPKAAEPHRPTRSMRTRSMS
ncbi:hypothetical protein LTR86_009412 [Recurvomyces mirabilis]|nr:hypothetical protein LTR86_009412 [Recurvomyces mirabilis]